MMQRRMRLNRGKEGDTGVVVPPSPAEVPREPHSPDEDLANEIAMVNEIAMTAIGDRFDPEQFEVAKQAVRLTMATMATKQTLAAPSTSSAPSSARVARVDRISVSINEPRYVEHTMLNGQAFRVPISREMVTIAVEGYHQHPRTLLQAALDQFDEKATYGISVSSHPLL